MPDEKIPSIGQLKKALLNGECSAFSLLLHYRWELEAESLSIEHQLKDTTRSDSWREKALVALRIRKDTVKFINNYCGVLAGNFMMLAENRLEPETYNELLEGAKHVVH